MSRIAAARPELPEKNPYLSVEYAGHEACAPLHSFGPAVRTHFLIHLVAAGRGRFIRGGVTYELGAGEGFLIVPGDTTFYCADEADPWEYYWIGFSGSEAERILGELRLGATQPIFRCDPAAVRHIADCIGSPAGPGRELCLAGNLYLLFSRIAASSGALGDSPHAGRCVGIAMRYIPANYSYDIKVEEIARHVGVSRSHLFKLFKAHNGVSVQRYILEYRLRMGAQMLKSSSHNISEVSYSCGFPDPNHFARAFKRFYGVSPSAFARRFKNASDAPDGGCSGELK